MYFSKNKDGELAIWLSWDDNLIVRPPQVMKDECKKLAKEIKIEDFGKVKERLILSKWSNEQNLPRPLMIHSFLDEFGAGKRSK